MTIANINETEVEDTRSEDDEREVEPLRFAISSYGADYPVDSLIRRLRDRSIFVPSFQRGFVWDIKEASRFIESLLLGLPVPSIFLSREANTGKLLVVDGQQRLLSLLYYCDGLWAPSMVEFSLRGVDKIYEGRTYRSLRDEERRRLDDSILHATIFKQDEPSNDDSGVFEVFERLNSGGKRLTAQEIRSALFHAGPMGELLQSLNQNASWRQIYGRKDVRMRDQELILRFLALFYDGESYESPLVFFLNRFMKKNDELEPAVAAEMKTAFSSAIEVINEAIGALAFRPSRALNAAVFDSVMVGVARRLRNGSIRNPADLKSAYDSLLLDVRYLDVCSRATASEDRVRQRLQIADTAFGKVA